MTSNSKSEALCTAIQENDKSKIRSILAANDGETSSYIDEQNYEGWNALMFAAKHNNVETAQDLIKRK